MEHSAENEENMSKFTFMKAEEQITEKAREGRRGRRPPDPDLQTMAKIDRLMEGLEPKMASLVYDWFLRKHAPVAVEKAAPVEKFDTCL